MEANNDIPRIGTLRGLRSQQSVCSVRAAVYIRDVGCQGKKKSKKVRSNFFVCDRFRDSMDP